MPFAVKLILSNIVIVSCVIIGKKVPSLSGLIAAMPLITLIVETQLNNRCVKPAIQRLLSKGLVDN